VITTTHQFREGEYCVITTTHTRTKRHTSLRCPCARMSRNSIRVENSPKNCEI